MSDEFWWKYVLNPIVAAGWLTCLIILLLGYEPNKWTIGFAFLACGLDRIRAIL
jgi:hypothetical protein